MANTYCHEGCCDLAGQEEKNSDKLLGIGVYAVFVLIVSAIAWYSISHGIYIDPALLQ